MSKVTIGDIKALRGKTSAGMGLCKEALVHAGGDMQQAIEYVNERSDVVSRLHDITGAKIGLCKMAFEDSGKDFEKALKIIKERGWEGDVCDIENPCEVKDGVIDAYVHGTDQKTVALVEVTCMTDFVARNEKFRSFAHEIAMQVAAMSPEYVSKEEITKEKLDSMKEIFAKELQGEKKPKEILEKIIDGKFEKFFKEKCLLEQNWFKDENKTIQSLLDEAVQQLGEPITIRRMLLWKLGG
jgi:elongation factor Ts